MSYMNDDCDPFGVPYVQVNNTEPIKQTTNNKYSLSKESYNNKSGIIWKGNDLPLSQVVHILNELTDDKEHLKDKVDDLLEKNKQLKEDVKYFNETYSIQEYGLDVETHIQLSSPILSRKELLNENKQLKEKLDYMEKALENILLV